jgi:hypothetical protein
MNAKQRNDSLTAAFSGGLRFAGPEPVEPGTPARFERVLTPEDKFANVLGCLVRLVDGPAHPRRMDAIRSTTHQLREQWDEYQAWLNGDTSRVETVSDDCPF